MSSRCNWSRKRARRWPPRRRVRGASPTSTNGPDGLGLPVQRAAGGLATGDGPSPAYEGELGGGGRRPAGGRYAECPKVTLAYASGEEHRDLPGVDDPAGQGVRAGDLLKVIALRVGQTNRLFLPRAYT